MLKIAYQKIISFRKIINSNRADLSISTPNSLEIFIINKLILTLGLIIPTIISQAASAAERIYITYGPLEFSIPIKALEIYAKSGKINEQLDGYASYLTAEQLQQLRQALIAPVQIEALPLSQFLYSPQGEIILERIGQIVKTSKGKSGFYAIRSALILSAADQNQLTLLEVLQKFPTKGIKINSQNGLQIIEELSQNIQLTSIAIAQVEKQAQQEIRQTQPTKALSSLADLSQLGNTPYIKKNFLLNDLKRQRIFPLDLYLPETRSPDLIPLIVISHGLGSDRGTYAYLAEHLASHGFAVAVPEHPGSNASQIQDLLNGFAKEVTPPKELIDRPKDIKYVLDVLEKSFGKRLNLKRVGILGQSFGGYTALAMAGANINYQQLQQSCSDMDALWDISLILQCSALELPDLDYNLQDDRIAATFAINPLVRDIFGRQQLAKIDIPVAIVSGSDDPVTPALFEQIEPFTWLTTRHKYLALLKYGTHFSTFAKTSGDFALPSEIVGPDPSIGQHYIKVISLAFFKTYIADESQYKNYLNAAYAQKISQQAMPLNLIQYFNQVK